MSIKQVNRIAIKQSRRRSDAPKAKGKRWNARAERRIGKIIARDDASR